MLIILVIKLQSKILLERNPLKDKRRIRFYYDIFTGLLWRDPSKKIFQLIKESRYLRGMKRETNMLKVT